MVDPVRPALDAVDHEVREELLVGELVVASDVEGVHVALAARPRVARPTTGADHVELLVVGREAEAIRIGHLVLADDEIDAPARIDAIAVGRQFALVLAPAHRLAAPRREPARAVAWA